jgi:hypothetical protein
LIAGGAGRPLQALLLAGLLLLDPMSLRAQETAEEAPSRSVAPTAGPTATPGEDWSRKFQPLEEEVARLKGRLSGETTSLEALSARVNVLEQSLDAQANRLKQVEADLAQQQTQLERQGLSQEALSGRLDAEIKRVEKSVHSVDDLNKDLADKRDALSTFQDLANGLKKDTDENSAEIVELKQRLAALQKDEPVEVKPAASSAWWEKASHWQYLPLVAVVISTVSLAVVLSK